jgi:beta-lactamase regulating signal transducer with metallopeptidase domain
MNSIEAFLASWMLDLAVVSTALLALACLVIRCLRAPGKRVVVGRAALWVLLLAIIACGVRSRGLRSSDVPVHDHSSESSRSCSCPLAAGDSTAWRRAGLVAGGTLAAGSAAWLCLGWWLTRRMVCRAHPAPERIEALARQVFPSRSHRVLVWTSAAAPRPLAVGALHPRIVLPEEFAAREDDQGVRLALAHEWAHIANGDLRFLAMGRALDLFFWAHPLYWWLRHCLRRDQELLADARACAIDDRCTYAERLVRWARAGLAEHRLPMAGILALWGRSRGGLLRERVSRLLDSSVQLEGRCTASWRWSVRLGAVALLAAILVSGKERAPAAAADTGETTQANGIVAAETWLELGCCAPPPKPSVWGCPTEVSRN